MRAPVGAGGYGWVERKRGAAKCGVEFSRLERLLSGVGEGKRGEVGQRYRTSVVSSEDLTHNVMTLVNNTVSYT